MQPLYQIANEYMELINSINESGEISDEQQQKLNQIEEDKKTKITNVALMIKNLENLQDGLNNSIIQMEKRQKIVNKQIHWLKNYLLSYANIDEIKNLNSPDVFIATRVNKYSLNILNESLIPKNYFKEKITNTLSRQSIIDDLKKGIQIEGAEFKTETTLTIK